LLTTRATCLRLRAVALAILELSPIASNTAHSPTTSRIASGSPRSRCDHCWIVRRPHRRAHSQALAAGAIGSAPLCSSSNPWIVGTIVSTGCVVVLAPKCVWFLPMHIFSIFAYVAYITHIMAFERIIVVSAFKTASSAFCNCIQLHMHFFALGGQLHFSCICIFCILCIRRETAFSCMDSLTHGLHWV